MVSGDQKEFLFANAVLPSCPVLLLSSFSAPPQSCATGADANVLLAALDFF